jgi:hypothetical protein
LEEQEHVFQLSSSFWTNNKSCLLKSDRKQWEAICFPRISQPTPLSHAIKQSRDGYFARESSLLLLEGEKSLTHFLFILYSQDWTCGWTINWAVVKWMMKTLYINSLSCQSVPSLSPLFVACQLHNRALRLFIHVHACDPGQGLFANGGSGGGG